MLGQKKFDEKIFYNLSLDRLVPADDFYRRLDHVLDLSFVRKECEPYYGSTGNPSIDPVVFFKILLVGYLENIVYDRQLSRRIRDSLSIRLFLRYDIDEELPWHSTISRTRQRLPISLYERVFDHMLNVCIQHNLVEGEHVAIDTTLLKANASLDDLERKQPEQSVTEYLESVYAMNDTTQERRTNETHRNRRDPDSRIATKPGTQTDLYYKGTAGVDPKYGIIIQTDAVYADRNDSQTLVETIASAQRRLADNGLDLESISADKAYCVGGVLKEVEELSVEAYIPLVKRTIKETGWKRERFRYNKEEDFYLCPNGKRLPFQYSNGRSKRYRASYKDCKSCPYHAQCVGKPEARLLFHPVFKEQFDALAKRLATTKARTASRWRKTVERTFGELCVYLGLQKINTLGVENARKKCIMAGVAYNLKKFMKYGYKYTSSPGIQNKNTDKEYNIDKIKDFFMTMFRIKFIPSYA